MKMCGIGQLLDMALMGYNVTIFVYGQTGSGKTFTMSGRDDAMSDDGLKGERPGFKRMKELEAKGRV